MKITKVKSNQHEYAHVGIHVQLVPENKKVTLFSAEHEFISRGLESIQAVWADM